MVGALLGGNGTGQKLAAGFVLSAHAMAEPCRSTSGSMRTVAIRGYLT